jgi:putative transposase
MIEPDHPQLSIGQQCKLLSIARSSFYYTPKGETEQNLDLMRQSTSSSWKRRSSVSGR